MRTRTWTSAVTLAATLAVVKKSVMRRIRDNDFAVALLNILLPSVILVVFKYGEREKRITKIDNLDLFW